MTAKPEPGTEAPTFSIVIATKNAEATLASCLESVEGQSFTGWELLVADGASTDATVQVLSSRQPRVGWWDSIADAGLYAAWNRAVPHARGTWLLFLGADDRLAAPDVLERASERVATLDPAVRLAYGLVDMVDIGGRVLSRHGQAWDRARRDFFEEMNLPHSGMFHRRDLFSDLGLFDEGMRIGGDYEFLLRELTRQEPAFLADLVVTYMGSRGMSQNPTRHGLAVREYHRARQRHGLTRRPEWLVFRLWRARAKAWLLSSLGPRPARLAVRLYRSVLGRPFDARP